MMIWSGVLLGLLAFQGARSWPTPPDPVSPPPAMVAAADPYAEARQSRAILEAQEGAPRRALPPAAVDIRSGDRGGADGGGRHMGYGQAGGPVRVIDGDTFDYGGMRIRVADIDTPEVRGRCPEEIQLAARATRRMSALLSAGPFELHPIPDGRDEDRYGRKLRIVIRGGRSLGDMLVAEGLARTWTGRREPWCA